MGSFKVVLVFLFALCFEPFLAEHTRSDVTIALKQRNLHELEVCINTYFLDTSNAFISHCFGPFLILPPPRMVIT